MYNTTFRVTVAGQERPVVLRVVPEPDRQFRSERQLMRKEYASGRWLTVIAPLMQQVIAADWSHGVIGRDWVIQSFAGSQIIRRPPAVLPVPDQPSAPRAPLSSPGKR
ncbi:hypothetical protein ACIOWG_28775 [Streptomyces sp. NPDC087658]|uniref:hypothetical protein n=1 Tax=Streptomyces sp. NPDC087658 TaxID=3365800 RepID=UPI0037F55450